MLNKILAFFIMIGVGSVVLDAVAAEVRHSSYSYDVEEEKIEPHRQTYSEYVNERLQVERMLR